MATLKINKFMASEPHSPAGKDYTIYSFSCEGEIDGKEGMFKCKTFNEAAAKSVVAGAVFENCEAKTWNNETEYILPKPQRSGGGYKGGGGGGGGYRKDPATELSILKQVVFKGAIELVCHDKIETKHMEKFIDKWVGILKGAANDVKEDEKADNIPF